MKSFNYSNIEVVDIDYDTRDYPDFCDSFITEAIWKDTRELLSDEELDELNDDTDFVYNQVINSIFYRR